MSLLHKARQLFQAPVATVVGADSVPVHQGTWSATLPTDPPVAAQPPAPSAPARADVVVLPGDRAAVERYRYLLRTSCPELVERVHTAAFARLTPAQRRKVLLGLAPEVPISERIAAADEPPSLARMATRAEERSPGTLERVFGAAGTAAGGEPTASLLAAVAAAVVDPVPGSGQGATAPAQGVPLAGSAGAPTLETPARPRRAMDDDCPRGGTA